MNRILKTFGATVCALQLVAWSSAIAHGADWPHFLGPNQNNISDETGLARQWPAAGPAVIWTQDVGRGFGGASIVGEEVFILDRDETGDVEQDILRCLDFATGEERWRLTWDAPGRFGGYTGSRSMPTVTDDLVLCVSPFGNFYAVDRATRETIWQFNSVERFGSQPPGWGFAHAPLVFENQVILPGLSQKYGLVALDPRSGEELWRTEEVGGETQSTTILKEFNGRLSLISVMGRDVFAASPHDGEVFWSFPTNFLAIPSPVVIDDNRLLVTSGYGAGTAMLRVENLEDGSTTVTQVWKEPSVGAQVHTPILYEDHFYANFNMNENEKNPPGLVCYDLDGNERWRSGPDPHFGRGGMLLADGLLFMLHGETGELYMIEPNSEEFRPLAVAKVLDAEGGEAWAPLSLSRGRLIVRDQHKLRCLDLREPGA